jgi:hypothetical protein
MKVSHEEMKTHQEKMEATIKTDQEQMRVEIKAGQEKWKPRWMST